MLPTQQFEQFAEHAYQQAVLLTQQQQWPAAQAHFLIALTNYLNLLQAIGAHATDHLYRRIGECGIHLSDCLRFQGQHAWWQPLVQNYGYLQHACQLNPANPQNQYALNHAASLYQAASQEAAAAHAQLPQPVGGDEDEDGFSLSRAILLCQAAEAAYVPNMLRAECYKFSARGAGGVLGFICDTGQEIIIAYRGSTMPRANHSLDKWLAVLRDWLEVNAGCRQVKAYGGRVHEGFEKVVKDTWPEVSEYVQRRYRGQTLWLTGHSMGGAVAILSAQRFWDADRPPAGVYTFGAPKVGDAEFCRRYQPKLYRIENSRDIVPELPLSEEAAESLEGQEAQALSEFSVAAEYSKMGVLRWIDSKGVLCKPTFGMELRRAWSALRSASTKDHLLERYLAA